MSRLSILCLVSYAKKYTSCFPFSIMCIVLYTYHLSKLVLCISWICIRFNIFNNLIYQTDIVLDRAAITAKNGLNMCWQLKGFATSTGHS